MSYGLFGGFGAGGNILNLAFATQATSVTSNTEAIALSNANRVLIMTLPTGRWSTLAAGYYAAIGGGNAWSANSSILPFAKLVTTTSVVTGNADLSNATQPMKAGIFCQRNGSATALSCTVMKFRIEFKAT